MTRVTGRSFSRCARMAAMSASVRRWAASSAAVGSSERRTSKQLAGLGGAHGGHAGVAVGVHGDQSLAAEAADGFAQGGDAHLHVVGEFVLGRGVSRGQAAGEDQSAEFAVGDVALTGEDVRVLTCAPIVMCASLSSCPGRLVSTSPKSVPCALTITQV